MKRKNRALQILKKLNKDKRFYYLGEGFSGIVFHDNEYVYKVHIPVSNLYEEDGLLYLKEKLHLFDNSDFFYKLDLFKVDNVYILKYKYEKSDKVTYITEEEYINFLKECWYKKMIFKNVDKKNFIRVNGKLKFIDYEIIPYNDNLFLNQAARCFVSLKYSNCLSEKEFNKLKRSVINNFNLPEMKGFDEFLSKLFFNITFGKIKLRNESNKVIKKDFLLKESTFWNLLKEDKFIEDVIPHVKIENHEFKINFEPKIINLIPSSKKVSLLIKTCIQDSKTIYYQIKHIIKQLASPNKFLEKVVLVDTRQKDFLREYNKNGSYEELYENLKRLKEEGVIDYIIELPKEEVEEINYRWFNLRTNKTHTISKIPITSQIYAFEKVKGDYILQIDSDAIIGRKDYKHSFIEDMIKALEENPNAVSVGFNIPKNDDVKFTPYHAPKGGYKPEVRFALIDKKKLLSLLPLPNELENGYLKLGWYHALHEYQKKTDIVSLRGGDSRSYYIHPQNYRKKCIDKWFDILDRVEKNIIPSFQKERFDVEGDFYDWCLEKRNEKLVVIGIIEEYHNINDFFRFFYSAINQKFNDFGMIIINNKSDLLVDLMLKNFLKNYKNVTYIHNKFPQKTAQNVYKAIHYFIENKDTFLLLANIEDYFLGDSVFSEVINKLENYNSDLLIGKEITIKNIENNGLTHYNFLNIEDYNSNLFSYIKVFKKYLFDSLNLFNLKIKSKNESYILSELQKYKWFDDNEFFVIFSLLTELAENPIRFDNFNYVIDRRILKISHEQINLIKNRKKSFIFKDRKDFIPNLKRIEIDITYDCNLKCLSCNRSCTQAPSKEYMSIDKIISFIEESIDLGHKWELINILGGEPTLHPKFKEIIRLLVDKYLPFSPNTIIQITSNGYSEKSRKLLDEVEKYSKNIFIDRESFKKDKKVIYFTQFNLAPIDFKEFKNADFKKGCWVTSYCGIGLNMYGYYACSVAGGIDRVIKKNMYIKKLKDITYDRLKEQLEFFCQFCGNFIEYDKNGGDFIPRCEKAPFKKYKISKTWKKFYNFYNKV